MKLLGRLWLSLYTEMSFSNLEGNYYETVMITPISSFIHLIYSGDLPGITRQIVPQFVRPFLSVSLECASTRPVIWRVLIKVRVN